MKSNQKVKERQIPGVCGLTKLSNDIIAGKCGTGRYFGRRIYICYIPQRRIPLQLISVGYDVQVNNGVAIYNMVQYYENTTNEVAEVEFLFSVPPNSVIIELEAKLGNNRVVALIKEKEEAKAEFQQGIQDGKTMLYSDYNEDYPDIVKAKLGNLGPQEKIQITYKYIEQLQVQVNEFWRLQIDPVVNPRYNQQQQNYLNNLFNFQNFNYNYHQDIKVTINMELEFVKSPSHQIEVQKLDLGTQITLSNNQPKNFVPQNAFVLIFQNKDIHQPQILVTHTNDDRLQHQRYCATIQFIPKFNPLNLDDAYQAYQETNDQETNIYDFDAKGEYIFVLDRSGSMSGKRIEKALQALRLFLQSLPLDSYFNVVSFGSTARRLHLQSPKYNDQSIQKTFESLESFSANMGGTEIKKCLEQEVLLIPRIKGYPRNIFLLTDGEVDPEPVLQLISENAKPDVRFYSLGIGNGCSQYMIQKIAFVGNGLSHIVADQEDLNEKVIDLLQDSITPYLQSFNFETNLPNQQIMVSNVLNVNCIKKNTPLTLQIIFKENDLVDENEQYFLNITYEDSSMKQYGLNTIINVNSSFETDYFHKLAIGKQIQQIMQNARLKNKEYLNLYAKDVVVDKQMIINLSLTYQILSPFTAFICEVVELQDDIKQRIKQKVQDYKYYQQERQLEMMLQAPQSKARMSTLSANSRRGGRGGAERTMMKASANIPYEKEKMKKSNAMPRGLEQAKIAKKQELFDDDEAEEEDEDYAEMFEQKKREKIPESKLQMNQIQQSQIMGAANQKQNQNKNQGNYIEIVNKFNLDGSVQESVLQALRIQKEALTLNLDLNLQILIAALVILELRFKDDRNSWILIFNKGVGYLKRNNIIYNSIKDQMIAILNLGI